MSFIKKTSVNGTNGGWDQNGYNHDIGFDKQKPEEKKNTSIMNGIREKLQINEWTFSLFLFCFSLSIVLGKLFVNYGDGLYWQMEVNYKLASLPAFPNIIANLSSITDLKPRLDFNGDRLMKAGEKFINISQRYEEAISDAVLQFSIQNWIWMKAALSGISMMAFTWYILYKDSSVPGVNPPSPLSLLKKRGRSRHSMHINYFVGVLNGILIFVYLIM